VKFSLVSDLAGWSGKARKSLLFNGTRVDLSQTPAFQFILRFSPSDTLTPQRDPFVTQRHRRIFLSLDRSAEFDVGQVSDRRLRPCF
jgi:hypothetical protein